MKIVRFETAEKETGNGIIEPGPPARVFRLEGDLSGEFRRGEEVDVVRLLAPLAPPAIYALGLNYRRHADETGIAYPEIPVVFIKAVTSLIGPDQTILLPIAGPDEVDFEGELAVVIGRTGKNIPRERVFDHILGYTCANDISARDWQNRLQKKQWARGKSFDTFCPIGPWIVTRDEVPDPDSLRLTTFLNDQVMQNSTTGDMIFPVADIVSDLSRSLTLLPGTLILTGTPEGVGFTRQPPMFLRAGDTVRVTIEGIGELANRVESER